MKNYFLLLMAAVITTACGQENKKGDEAMFIIRKPAVAGTFYPGDKKGLETEVLGYINNAKPEEVNGRIIGIVSPHAGYVYSGPVAGFAYKLIMGKKYETVVVISPSHQEFFRGCSVYNGDAYETPLGQIKVDKETAKSIANKVENIYLSDKGHRINGMGEHALEVQLPFLQVALGEFKIVPIVIGDQNEENCRALGNVLGEVLKDKNALIVASSDLSHYHPYSEAQKIDRSSIECFEKGDLKGMLRCEACGSGPIYAMLLASQKLGATKNNILKYATSGDVPVGEKGRVVGYMSGTINGETKKISGSEVGFDLTIEEKRELITLAKKTISDHLEGKKLEDYTPKSEIMSKKCGAFVTLHKKGELRGCIGQIVPVDKLYNAVQSMAIAAAFEDPRFYPLTKEEFPQIEFEISVLSPFEKITNIGEIEVGKHGLMISKNMYHGLLLPQVATEFGWDLETFLRHLCRKAGLSDNAYLEPGIEILKFTAIVFGEKDLK
jgi:MEMO1 family protein